MRRTGPRPARRWLLLAVGLLLASSARGGADDDPLFGQVKAERTAADAVWAEGAPLVALADFEALVERLEDTDDVDRLFLRASIEARLGTLSRQLGELDEAQVWWNRSLEDYQASDRWVSAGKILANLAIAKLDAGRSDLALDWLTEAIDLHEALDRPAAVAFDVYLRASVHSNRGEFGPALRDLVTALELFVEHGEIEPGGRDRPWYLHCRSFIAQFVLQLGEPRVAAEELARVLADEALSEPRLRAEWQLVEATAWAQAGETERALASLSAARETVEEFGLTRLQSTLLRIDGEIAMLLGDLPGGCRTMEAARLEAQATGLPEHQLIAGGLWAGCLNDLGESRRALLVAREAQLLAESIASPRAWESWHEEARAHLDLGDLDAANVAYAEATTLLSVLVEELELDTVAIGRLRMSFDDVFGGAASARLAVAQGPEDIEAALDYVEQNRSRLLLNAVLGGHAASPELETTAPELETTALPGPTRRALGRVRGLPALQDRPWLERLRLRAAGTADGAGVMDDAGQRRERALGAFPLGVATLRSRLPRSLGVAIFRSREGGTDLFWLERDRVERHWLPGDADHLRGLVDRYVSAMARSVSDEGSLPEFEQASQSLRRATLGPVEQRLRGVSQLVVVPDGDLYRVPFAALRDGDRYLVEQAAVSVAPSLNILDALLDRTPDRLSSFVGVADSRSDLPRARAEVEEAAALFERRRVLAGDEAQLAGVLGALQGADILHFATHGELEGAGEPSWLALARGQALDAEAILDLDLDLPLVTLSACRSARGSQQAGEALVNSLARAFLAAGAESVVGSLWDVHDGSTGELMSRFYEALAAGSFVSVGLAEAQRGMALSGGEFAHPWYWAGFVVVGDPR